MAQVRVKDVHIGERRRKDLGDIDEMMADLKENGQITPITVRPPTDVEKELGVAKPLVLIAGGRRIISATMLGWEFIEAYTREDEIDELKHRMLELRENLGRKDMTWDEISQAKLEMLTIRQEMAAKMGQTITQAEVAVELGESPSTFSRDIKAAEAIAETPSLKKAGSRKAALRAVEMADHVKTMDAREYMDHQRAESFREVQRLVVTADGRDYIRTIAPRSIDLILTDPPYAIDYFKGGQKMRSGGKNQALGISQYDDKTDAIYDVLADMVPQWARVIRESGWICVFVGEETETFLRKAFSDCCIVHADYRAEHTDKVCMVAKEENSTYACRFLVPEKKCWIWYRPNSRNQPRYPERHAKNVYENILVVNAGYARLAKKGDNVLVFDGEYGDDRIHVMQKPAALASELVQRFTYMGDTVLDTFFGSGVFLASAARAARYIMGCDENPDMLGPALGYIAKNFMPTPTNGRSQAADREHQYIQKGSEGVLDFGEEEVELES